MTTRTGRPILVVDDNADLAENMAEILAEAGHVVETCTSPDAALARVKPGSHALMLLDMRLPGMDGAQLHRAIRAVDPGLPVVAITAHARQETVHAALKDGVCAVMSKPVDYATLLSRVHTLLQGRRVLVVEDNLDQSVNLVEALLEGGLAARHCGSLAEARLIQETWPPDALLVDRHLPDGLGDALVVAGGTHTRAVLCTGFTLPGDIQGPHVTVMQKPLELPRVLAVLRAGAA